LSLPSTSRACTPLDALAPQPLPTGPGENSVWPPVRSASASGTTPPSTAHAHRGHRPPDTSPTADVLHAAVSPTVWLPSTHNLAGPVPHRYCPLPRPPAAKWHDCLLGLLWH